MCNSNWNSTEANAASTESAVLRERVLICPFCSCEFLETNDRVCPTCGHNCKVGEEIWIKLRWSRIFTWLGLILLPFALSMPLLSMQNMGGRTEVSFFTGLQKLMENRDYVLVIVIALFSGVLPVLKSLAMVVLTSSSFLSGKHSRLVYRFVELTSRFSMADVYISAASIMLFKASPMFRFSAQPGLVIFTSMVICNLLAALCYDTRVLGFVSARQRSSDHV